MTVFVLGSVLGWLLGETRHCTIAAREKLMFGGLWFGMMIKPFSARAVHSRGGRHLDRRADALQSYRGWYKTHEAREQIDETLRRLDEPGYENVYYRDDIQHMLHHLHTAYNSRNAAYTAAISHEEFLIHQRPPVDIEWE